MAYWGISARNDGQKAAIRALTNDKPYCFLTGPSGTGKTIITQAIGMHKTLEDKDFRKLLYTRMQIQLGEDQGFLPGNIDEKTYPFLRAFYDNLELMSDKAKEVLNYFAWGKEEKRKIFFDPIQTMRGGSLHYTYLMCDESQNLDIHTMCGLATRLSEGSKFIFMGNFAQIDKPSLRKPESNGLYQLLSGLYESKAFHLFNHVNLTQVERHTAVDLVERILRNHTIDERFEELEKRGNVTEVDKMLNNVHMAKQILGGD